MLAACTEYVPRHAPLNLANAVLTTPRNSAVADGQETALVVLSLTLAQGGSAADIPVRFASIDNGPWVLDANQTATLADGTASTTVRSTVVGDANISATIMTPEGQSVRVAGSVGVHFTQPITSGGTAPRNPNSALSVVTLSPNVIVADGNSTATITLTLNDDLGNPIGGEQVTFTSSDITASFAPSNVQTTNATTGVVFVGYASTQVGNDIIYVNAAGFSLSIDIVMVPGPVAQVALNVNPNIVTADDASLTTFSAAAYDAWNHPIPNAAVTFAVDGANTSIAAETGTTQSDGTYSTTAHSPTAQNENVSLKCNGFKATAPLLFVAGSPNAFRSTISVSPSATPADGNTKAAIVVTAADAFGNLTPNQNVVVAMHGLGNRVLSPLFGQTNASGQFTVDVTSLYAGDKKLKATIAGTQSITGVATFVGRTPPQCSGLPGLPMAPSTSIAANGNLADWMVLKDVSGDGNVDVLVATASGAAVALNRGNGSFGPATNFNTSTTASGIVVGNYTADTLVDFLVSLETTGATSNVNLYTGLGGGAFTFAASFNSCKKPMAMVGADFTGDGNQDVAVACYASPQPLGLLSGNGNGGFTYFSPTNLPGAPVAMSTGHFHSPTITDLVVLPVFTSALWIYTNNGTGAFTLSATLTTPSIPNVAATGDLNGDGYDDIVATDYVSNDISVFLTTGSSTFAAATNYPTGVTPFGATIADFTGDGHLDVAVGENADGNTNTGAISLFAGSPNGTLSILHRDVLYTQIAAIASAQLNNDAHPDLMVSTYNNVTGFMNNGNGTLQTAGFINTGSGVSDVDGGDLNGDGNQDIFVGEYNSGTSTPYFGNGDGTFTAGPPLSTVGVQTISLIDLDDNGTLDVVATQTGASTNPVFLNDGTGSFAPWWPGLPAPYGSGGAAFGDLNNDGNTDYVAIGGGNVVTYLGSGRSLLFIEEQNVTLLGTAYDLAVQDFDFDGNLDMVISSDSNGFGFYQGNGDCTFKQPVWYGISYQGLAAGDINGDGALDVVTYANKGNVTVWLGVGDGTFAASSVVPAVLGTQTVMYLADINGDGYGDIVAGGYRPFSNILVFLGNATGTLGQPLIYLSGSDTQALAIRDFNNDGRVDIVTAVFDGGGPNVLLNTACY